MKRAGQPFPGTEVAFLGLKININSGCHVSLFVWGLRAMLMPGWPGRTGNAVPVVMPSGFQEVSAITRAARAKKARKLISKNNSVENKKEGTR